MAKSEAPADPRPYVRVSTDLPTNPKLDAIDDPAAGWAYVVSLCYCAQSLTDGHFAIRAVLRMANVDQAVAAALVEQELWHLPGHDCDRCEQPKTGHALVHDYLQHQRSSEEVRDLTAKRREAGRKGAAKRWGDPKSGKSGEKRPEEAPSMANAMANAKQESWQTDGNTMAEEMRGEERRREEKIAPAAPRSALATIEPATADQLIGEWIEHCRRRPPGSVIGQVGKQIKQMLAEGVDPADMRRGLAAWHTKGLHPSALPSVVNELMNAPAGRAGNRKPSTTDERVNAALALAAQYDAQEVA